VAVGGAGREMIAAMEGTPAPMMLPGDDPVAIALLLAVRGGDLAAAGSLLVEHPGWREPGQVLADWLGEHGASGG
jgi:hypothetical protein